MCFKASQAALRTRCLSGPADVQLLSPRQNCPVVVFSTSRRLNYFNIFRNSRYVLSLPNTIFLFYDLFFGNFHLHLALDRRGGTKCPGWKSCKDLCDVYFQKKFILISRFLETHVCNKEEKASHLMSLHQRSSYFNCSQIISLFYLYKVLISSSHTIIAFLFYLFS